jgi:hypothetical protein
VRDDFLDFKPGKPAGPGAGAGPVKRIPGSDASRPGVIAGPGGVKPGAGIRHGRPGAGPGVAQRPPRPNRPDKWNSAHDNFTQNWNKWHQTNANTINNFKVNRSTHWKNINRWGNPGWVGNYHSDDYWKWRHDVWDYRKDRCEEIWDNVRDYHEHFFDDHWWGYVWWNSYPSVYYADYSPWWWWRPVDWVGVSTFFGPEVIADPVYWDPGTTIIYEGDTVYVNGDPAGPAVEYRRKALDLARPPVEEVPVPAPAPVGEEQVWLPMGVWALTQQEQGDAVMFFQLSIDKAGLVAGAYKNVLSGDEQPLVGQLDKKTQRVAWHVGDAVNTVYETTLPELTADVASVFVHFGEMQTQTWLLVRLPSPEMPPTTVKIPELKK